MEEWIMSSKRSSGRHIYISPSNEKRIARLMSLLSASEQEELKRPPPTDAEFESQVRELERERALLEPAKEKSRKELEDLYQQTMLNLKSTHIQEFMRDSYPSPFNGPGVIAQDLLSYRLSLAGTRRPPSVSRGGRRRGRPLRFAEIYDYVRKLLETSPTIERSEAYQTFIRSEAYQAFKKKDPIHPITDRQFFRVWRKVVEREVR
jgi:hypothetical protein